MEFVNFENYERKYADEAISQLSNYIEFSLMSEIQRYFINGIIRKIKPKKILEVGVSAGVNSAIILNAIKDIDDSKLYSIDILKQWHRDNAKLSGFVVEEKCPNLMNKWKIYRGNIVSKFIEEIGSDIELCILDAAHVHPGEFLDFLLIAPFLSKNAIVIIHDIELHNTYPEYDTTCGSLFSTIKGKKFYPNDDMFYNDTFNYPNIGAIILDDNFMEYIEDVFFLLTLPWKYIPSEEDNTYIINNLKKHYNPMFVETYKKILEYTKSKFNEQNTKTETINISTNDLNQKIDIINNEIYNTNKKLDNLINSIAWCIPNKKLRNNFRNKIYQTRPDQTRPDQTRP